MDAVETMMLKWVGKILLIGIVVVAFWTFIYQIGYYFGKGFFQAEIESACIFLVEDDPNTYKLETTEGD